MQTLYLIANISRQGHFKEVLHEKTIAEKSIFYVGLMYKIREFHPGMGLRKMYEQFQPEGIGRDAWINLGLQEGFRMAPSINYYKTTYAIKSNKYENLLIKKEFTDVNQLWVSDIFYFPLNEKNYYAVLIMDVYSRKIVGGSIADNMRAENNTKALSMALKLRGISNYNNNLIHHSDRGSQYMSDVYTEMLEEYQIRISVCFDVLENAHCERANGTIKNEYLNRWSIKDEDELFYRFKEATENYNNRKHNSIKMTPNVYEIFLNEVPLDKREKMEIFTIKSDTPNPFQLELKFDL